MYSPWKQCGTQCFGVLACNNVQIRYIHGALRSGLQQCAMDNATIQKTTFFELGVYILCSENNMALEKPKFTLHILEYA